MSLHTISPAGREFLAFSLDIPDDWKIAAVPAEDPNFEDPTYFLPLAAAVSPSGDGAITAGARMAFSDGALLDWLQFLTSSANIDILEIERFTAGKMTGVRFDARQQTLRMRNLYIEDGGRLYAISAMAEEQAFDAIAPALTEVLESFRLAEAAGPTVPLSSAIG